MKQLQPTLLDRLDLCRAVFYMEIWSLHIHTCTVHVSVSRISLLGEKKTFTK